DLDLYKFQSKDRSPANYSRYTDRVLDELYEKQGRAPDAEERKKYIREFERRLLDEEVHYIYTLQWHRIIPHSAKVKGWTITPSHYLNQQLDTVWLTERALDEPSSRPSGSASWSRNRRPRRRDAAFVSRPRRGRPGASALRRRARRRVALRVAGVPA